MVTGVDVATALVLRLKLALVPPGETVTLAGTTAAGLLLESVTCAPPAGAGAFSVTVPVEGLPPVTLVGLRASDETIGGITGSGAVCVAPPEDAGMAAGGVGAAAGWGRGESAVGARCVREKLVGA